MKRITSRTDQKALRQAAQKAHRIMDILLDACQEGTSTVQLEALAVEQLALERSSAPFRLFDGFNHATCISLNDEIVNGPPSRERKLLNGAMVKVAIGTEVKGLHGKVARTKVVGDQPNKKQARLMEGCQAVFERIEGKRFSTAAELLNLMPQLAEEHDLRLIDKACGYSIGKGLHQLPAFPCDPKDLKADFTLEPGLAFTLMPMMTLGSIGTFHIHQDGWTEVQTEGALCAHFCETLWINSKGLIERLSSNEKAL